MARIRLPQPYDTDGTRELRAWLAREHVKNRELVEKLATAGLSTTQQTLNRRLNGQAKMPVNWGLALARVTGIAPILFRTPEERIQWAESICFTAQPSPAASPAPEKAA